MQSLHIFTYTDIDDRSYELKITTSAGLLDTLYRARDQQAIPVDSITSMYVVANDGLQPNNDGKEQD